VSSRPTAQRRTRIGSGRLRDDFFPDLVATTAADEQTAIHAGQIQPTRIDYVGTRH